MHLFHSLRSSAALSERASVAIASSAAAACASAVLALATPVAAQTPDAPHPPYRVTYDSTLGIRVNPLGVEERLNVLFRRRLYSDPAPILREANVAAGVAPTFTPSIIRLGPVLEFRPLTLLTFSAAGYFQSWLPTFNNLQSLPTPTAPHSDDDLRAGGDAGESYGTTGAELQLRAQALGKVGPVVLRTDASFHLANVALEGEDTVYYEPRSDLVVPDGGWWFIDDTDLVVLTDFGLIAGARATISSAFYRDHDFAPNKPTNNPNNPTAHLNPIVTYTFFDRPGAVFNRPTVVFIANWWLAHRYRTGEESSAALPYLTLAFRFEGDLYRSEP